MASRNFTLIVSGATMVLLAGCADPLTKIPTDVDADGMPNAELALQRSMTRVDAAMRELGGMRLGDRAPPGQDIVPAELQRPVNFAWSGSIDAGVKALADRIGYRFVVTNDAPPGQPGWPRPVTIAVNLTGVPILDLFKATGAAAGTQATVIVDPDHHQVEVQHHV